MSPITAARQQLADLVAGVGVEALAYVPEEFPSGVVAIIDGADGYFDRGETFGDPEEWFTFTLYVLADIASNQQATEDVDTALGAILPALRSAGIQYGPGGKPGAFHTANWLAHGVSIPLTLLINLDPATQE